LRADAFLDDIEVHVNTVIFGSLQHPSQWKCPREDNCRAIGKICMDNDHTRDIMHNIDGLIVLCIFGTRKEQWKRAANNYNQAMIMLCRKERFTGDDVFRFQGWVDMFAQDWLEMYGKDGVTNYIHMLLSGHVAEFLRHWGSLYEHSQQGWEALNALVKTYWFRRTNRGGATGWSGKGTHRSRLVPLARWLTRRIVWAMGKKWKEIVDWLVAEGFGDSEAALMALASKTATEVMKTANRPVFFRTLIWTKKTMKMIYNFLKILKLTMKIKTAMMKRSVITMKIARTQRVMRIICSRLCWRCWLNLMVLMSFDDARKCCLLLMNGN
jgi:hypothetical protein